MTEENRNYSHLLGEPLVGGAAFEKRQYEGGLSILGIIHEKKLDSV